MAGGTYELTHQRILESGRHLFLKYGYERANLRELCRGAGVTTGAFYRHFSDKEALFSELVKSVVQELPDRYSAAEERCFSHIAAGDMEAFWAVSVEILEDFLRYIYAHFTEFKLLLHCAEGTQYAGFTDRFVERELKDFERMYRIWEERGIAFRRVEKRELHMLVYAYFSCIFEAVLHDYGREEALEAVHTLASFFTAGWRKVLGV